MSEDIKQLLANKGYSPDSTEGLNEIGALWGVKRRQMYNILKDPKPIHIYASMGMPRKRKSAV